jgi:nucleotide-binding universal stress UspA family protein
MYTRIVVPLDGSDLAEQALATAEDMARATDAAMHLVRVVDFPPTAFTYAYGAMIESDAITMQLDDELRLASDYLSAVATPLVASGLTVTTEVRHGIAIQELIDAMTPGDLYVIASHGRSGVARWFLGSVAEEITRRASVPVLLVRAASVGRRTSAVASAMTA